MAAKIADTARSKQLSPNATERRMIAANAILERGRYSWMWVVPQCPYCHKQHDHYAGPLDGDPSLYLGHSMPARCDTPDRRRLLPDHPAAELRYILQAELR